MQTMYPGIINSPVTELAAAIDDAQTSFYVQDGAALPDAPNLAVIGQGAGAETVLYTTKTGNTLSGVTRGFQGAAAAHPLGTKVARNFTEYDYRALMVNIDELDDDLTAHINDESNPHGVTKAQVGLGSVDNFPTASQTEAEMGTSSNRFMTPLRTKQAIAALVPPPEVEWRINNDIPEWSNNGGGTWNPVGDRILSMTPNPMAYYAADNSGLSIPANGTIDVFSYTGSGILSDFYIAAKGAISSSTNSSFVGVEIVVDGTVYQLHDGSFGTSPALGGSYVPRSGASSTYYETRHSTGMYSFNNGFTIRIRNMVASTASNVGIGLNGVFYT